MRSFFLIVIAVFECCWKRSPRFHFAVVLFVCTPISTLPASGARTNVPGGENHFLKTWAVQWKRQVAAVAFLTASDKSPDGLETATSWWVTRHHCHCTSRRDWFFHKLLTPYIPLFFSPLPPHQSIILIEVFSFFSIVSVSDYYEMNGWLV